MRTACARGCLIATIALLGTMVLGTECYEGCRFHLCGATLPKSYDVLGAPPDQAATPPICDKDGHRIGVVGSTGELRVVADLDARRLLFIPVSDWHPNAPPSAIKAYASQGIGHQVLSKGVEDSLRGRCVALPLHAWQILDEVGHVLRNEHTPSPREQLAFVNCVALVVK